MINGRTPLRAIAVQVPGGASVLAQHRLEYWCEGGSTLAAACERADVPVEAVLLDLDDAQRAEPAEPDDRRWMQAPLSLLVAEIVRVHHQNARTEFERLARYLAAARDREEGAHPELARVAELLEALAEELEPHMVREEREIFPLLVALERAPANERPSVPAAQLERALHHDHLSQGEVLRELRRLTFGYQPPDGASLSLRLLYQGLERLEADLVRHLHLENNVLFPRARALARKGRAP